MRSNFIFSNVLFFLKILLKAAEPGCSFLIFFRSTILECYLALLACGYFMCEMHLQNIKVRILQCYTAEEIYISKYIYMNILQIAYCKGGDAG